MQSFLLVYFVVGGVNGFCFKLQLGTLLSVTLHTFPVNVIRAVIFMIGFYKLLRIYYYLCVFVM